MSIRRFIQVMRTPNGWMLRFRGSAGDITWHILATACPVKDKWPFGSVGRRNGLTTNDLP